MQKDTERYQKSQKEIINYLMEEVFIFFTIELALTI